MLTIGKAATLTALSAKTIRYYEGIGLISPALRSDNGYRYFTQRSIEELNLVKGARDSGFTIEQCKELMALFRDKGRHSSEVKALTNEKISQIKHKILALNNIVQSLEKLSDQCQGNELSGCAILDGLIKK